jgi:hypothetical protein
MIKSLRSGRYEYCGSPCCGAAAGHAHLPTHPRHVRHHHRQPERFIFIFRAAARHVFPRTLAMSDSQPPPPGIYVPAVLFFKENEDIDVEATKSHIHHLAQVHTLDILLHRHTLALTATFNS